ncbi:MAG TPA: FecR family protein [bacterium]
MTKRITFLACLFLFLVLGLFLLPRLQVRADEAKSAVKVTLSPIASKASGGAKKSNLTQLFLAKAEGEASLIHGYEKKRAFPPQSIEANDRIVTGKDGTVYLEFQEGGTIEIGPNSDMKVGEVNVKPDTFKARFLLAFGKVRSLVKKLTTASSSFEIEAGGTVAGVRGTVFEVGYDKSKDRLTDKTFEGSIYARANGNSKENIVDKGNSMTVDKGGPPVFSALTPDDIANFQNFVNVAGDLQKKKAELMKGAAKFMMIPLFGGGLISDPNSALTPDDPASK